MRDEDGYGFEGNFFVGVFWASAFGIFCWLMFALGYLWNALFGY
jgi:hypothetical protein